VAHCSKLHRNEAKRTECGVHFTGTSVMEFMAIRIELNTTIVTCTPDANIDTVLITLVIRHLSRYQFRHPCYTHIFWSLLTDFGEIWKKGVSVIASVKFLNLEN
jgi:hypothetical protein